MIAIRVALRRQRRTLGRLGLHTLQARLSPLALLLVFVAFSLPGVVRSQGAAGPLVPEECQKEPCPLELLETVVANVFNWLVIVAGSAAVLAVVVAGTRYIVAVLRGADSGAIAEAKQALTFAIFGTVLLLVSYLLVRTVCLALVGSQSCPVPF